MYNKCFGLSLSVSITVLSRLSSHFLYSLIVCSLLLLLWDPFLLLFPSYFIHFDVNLFILSSIPPSLSFAVQSISHTVNLYIILDSSFYLSLPLDPLFSFPFSTLILIASPSHRHPVSSFLHLPPSFFLHVSWYCRRVLNVPQTLFSTIKLLSLPSPAAARITWAEQALLNIEQQREGGTRG